jgi:hypothetical protein
MITALATAQKLNWQGWLLGIWGAVVSGGAGAVASGFGTMVVDPDHFNVSQGGFHHLLYVMGICFGFSSIISLAKFLQTHPSPDPIAQQAALDKAAEATKVVEASIAVAKATAPEAPKP